jgi:hypothetical protein
MAIAPKVFFSCMNFCQEDFLVNSRQWNMSGRATQPPVPVSDVVFEKMKNEALAQFLLLKHSLSQKKVDKKEDFLRQVLFCRSCIQTSSTV